MNDSEDFRADVGSRAGCVPALFSDRQKLEIVENHEQTRLVLLYQKKRSSKLKLEQNHPLTPRIWELQSKSIKMSANTSEHSQTGLRNFRQARVLHALLLLLLGFEAATSTPRMHSFNDIRSEPDSSSTWVDNNTKMAQHPL